MHNFCYKCEQEDIEGQLTFKKSIWVIGYEKMIIATVWSSISNGTITQREDHD